MKKIIPIIGFSLFSTLSMADYFAIINLDNVKLSSPVSPDPTIRCASGSGETRASLIAKIDNGDDVSNVCTSNITNFSELFYPYRSGANFSILDNFNQDISKWDVSNGTDFSYMFHYTKNFNQDIGDWDVSNGTNFYWMFYGASKFNQNIGNWDMSKATNIAGIFTFATNFNNGDSEDIKNWDVSKNIYFNEVFSLAVNFNQPLNWDVSSGTQFTSMFSNASEFNQDISNWNVSNGTQFTSMFESAGKFNQDIHLWDVENATHSSYFKDGSALTVDNTPCDFGGNCSLDSDNDGVLDHNEVYNGTNPLDPSSS